MLTESPLARRLIWNLIPLALVLVAIGSTLLGNEGIVHRSERRQRLYAVQAEVEAVQAENARLRAHVQMLRHDPRAIRRELAEQLHLAPAGSVLYRFEEADSSSPSR